MIVLSDHSCEKDGQCPNNQKCVRKWCECVPPFILDGEICKRMPNIKIIELFFENHYTIYRSV